MFIFSLFASIKKKIPVSTKDAVKRFIPNLKNYITNSPPYFRFVQWRYARIIKKLKKKEKIRVAFFATYSEIWKYDKLYNLMLNHSRFEPIIFVCPVVNYGKENMLAQMEKSYTMFRALNYNVVNTYNQSNDSYVDVKVEYTPDIIFYTNPYQSLVMEKYFITNFLDTLSCYVPYSFMVLRHKWAYDGLFYSLAWRLFYPNELYNQFAKRHSANNSKNVCITGYPMADIFSEEVRKHDPWKIKEKNVKRIIWAPHHTIDPGGDFRFSGFMKSYMIMYNIAEKFRGQIQIAFKPHPLLKLKLYEHKDWGKDKTDVYYKKWAELSNGQLAEGDYVDLFLTSDAMIHDCASFSVEYHYTTKPVMFIAGDGHMEQLSDFGLLAYNMHYKGAGKNDFEKFIEDVVIKGNDFMFEDRQKFFNEHLLPPNGKCVSQNIIDEILKNIGD